MQVPACDRPPTRTAAIVARVQDQEFPALSFGRTVRMPRSAIRGQRGQQITNTAPDLSIARARLTSIAAEASAELNRYARLAAGWDGYSAEPISPVAIEIANALVGILESARPAAQHLTDIIPGPAPDGSLDLELRAEKRRLIITIYAGSEPNTAEIRTFRTDGETSEEKNDLEPDALVADLLWLLA